MCAPQSITLQIARSLSADYNVKLYDCKERLNIHAKQGDILLGHVWNDPDTIVWKALADGAFEKKFIIGPYNHNPLGVVAAYDAVNQCDKFFAICGDYWIETLPQSPFYDFRDKIVHLNMAIDTDDYPLVKTVFNEPGKRKFLYIGRTAPEKGTDILEQLAESVPGFKGGYLCARGGGIKGWEKLDIPKHFTPDVMRKVASEYDFFINMSRMDAQATTILEAMCWGFPVLCTRQSGYTLDNFFYLDLEDMNKNIQVINLVQYADERELKKMSMNNREKSKELYSWETFLSKLKSNI